MDPNRFDALALLAGAARSRRAFLTGIVVALGAGSGVAADKRTRRKGGGVSAQGPCGDGSVKHNACKRHNQCCTGYCNKKSGRCRCRRRGQTCTNTASCCTGRGQHLRCQGTGRKTCQSAPPATCTPATCPGGCCDGSQCRSGNAPGSCGAGGQACQACAFSCVDGACTDCTGSDVCARGCTYSSLEAAVNAAASGDTIRICAGRYVGTDAIAQITKSLTIVGVGAGENPRTSTILDGNRITGDRGGVILVGDPDGSPQDITVTVSNLRITGGQANLGGGVANYRETLVMTECTVTGNRAAHCGGVMATNGDTTLTNCTVSGNQTTSPAGQGGGLLGDVAVVALDGCTVSGNEAWDGGGIYFTVDCQATITDSLLSGNTAGAQGGGVNTNGTVTLDGATISGNDAAANGGGGVYTDSAGITNVTNGSSISGNDPDNCAGSGTLNGTCG